MREFYEVYDEGETCPKCLDALAKSIHIDLQTALAENKRLREALGGLLTNIREHHEGKCPGITKADCLDAIYEAANIAQVALCGET